METLSETIPKGNLSQMDAQISEQINSNRDKKGKFKRKTIGPMGVTNISKQKIRLSISIESKLFLWMILECLILGALLNVSFSNFGFKIGIINFLGWAIMWWLVKFRLPDIAGSYRK